MQITRNIDIEKFTNGFNDNTTMIHKRIHSEKDATDYIQCLNESNMLLLGLMQEMNTFGDFSFNLGAAFAVKIEHISFHNEVIKLIHMRAGYTV